MYYYCLLLLSCLLFVLALRGGGTGVMRIRFRIGGGLGNIYSYLLDYRSRSL